MDSRGQLFRDGEPKQKSNLLLAYEELSSGGFAQFRPELSQGDLDWMQQFHDKSLDFYREERRMHFFAFALAALAFIILFPSVLTAREAFLPLVAVEGLLLILLIPYVFVYRRYEEGVRRMMRESIIIENHRRRIREMPSQNGS